MSDWFVFIVASLAVFRAAELIVYDKIFQWLRDMTKGIWMLDTLTTCYFCTGTWVAAGATWYAYWLGHVDSRHAFGYFLGLAGMSVVIHGTIRERK